jgi:hypothetical protein
MTQINDLDLQISDLIDYVDNGTLNDIFLDAIVEGDLKDEQIVAILSFVLKELKQAAKKHEEIVMSADYKNVDV